jgi:2-polyprenyl-3-methyl-5-hydroxy-6-metoxy-1,4-benzoquinol methylase
MVNRTTSDKTDATGVVDRALSLGMTCRFCGHVADQVFVDLGMSPLCESFLAADQLNQMEPFYPLRVNLCPNCFLVQLAEYVAPENIFSEYAYFSSYSHTWVEHARKYVEQIRERVNLTSKSFVVELASNDGYLLQHFVKAGVPVLGIEPAANVAEAACAKQVPTRSCFFGREVATDMVARGEQPDLLIGNNVLAHVPDLNDFVGGMKILLKPNGVLTMEFPHLMRLMEGNQFDTIYHEHFSYFSFLTAERVFAAHGLSVFDVDEIPTHGGSLRVYVRHAENHSLAATAAISALRSREEEAGFTRLETYRAFDAQVMETKRKLLDFLIAVKGRGESVAGYGAPGKGNTLLNYCGIRTDFLDYTVDRNPYKHFKFLPGSHIPIFPPERIRETQPDWVLILPWNLKDEVVAQLSYVRDWGGKLVVPIPSVEICA